MTPKDPFNDFLRTFRTTLLLSVVISVLLLSKVCTGIAHGATTTKHSNSLGVVVEQDNPFTYKAGTVAIVGLVDHAVVLRLQPLATYNLYTEDILMCDRAKIAPLFQGKHNPLLLTYKTKDSRMVQGIGCHTLVRVDEFKSGSIQ